MKGLIIILSLITKSNALSCDCNGVVCDQVQSCDPGYQFLPAVPEKCQCCPRCDLIQSQKDLSTYKPCNEDQECGEGLKCSKASHLCVDAEKCPDIEQCVVRCAIADQCFGGYKRYFACGCCSACENYIGLNGDCSQEGVQCFPDFKCSQETRKCEWKGNPPGICAAVFCVNVDVCPAGKKLLLRDPQIGRCCNICE